MKVFKIVTEPDRYRSLLVKNDRWHDGDKRFRLLMDGSEKRSLWKRPLQTVVDGKRLPEPDIIGFNSGDLVLHKRSLDLLGPEIEKYAELLPLSWEGGKGFLINVLGLSDCMDEKATTWLCDEETGERLIVERVAFRKARVPQGRMFRVSKNPFGMFCTDVCRGDDGLFAAVKKYRLSGIQFKEEWSQR